MERTELVRPNNNNKLVRELNAKYLACPFCDAIWNRPVLSENQQVKCKRCHSVILKNKPDTQQRTLALMISSLILYGVTISFPFLQVETAGLSNQISLLDCVTLLWQNNMPLLALISGIFILFFPLCRLVMILLVCSGSKFHKYSNIRALVLRGSQLLEPWAMEEIFLIGVLISLVKITAEASIQLGPAFWAMSGLVIVVTLATTSFCKDTLWQRIRDHL